MGDVTWITTEQILKEFIVEQETLDAKVVSNQLDVKFIPFGDKRQKLYMQHQIIAAFDARDTALKIDQSDIKTEIYDFAKFGFQSAAVAVTAATGIREIVTRQAPQPGAFEAYKEVLSSIDKPELHSLARSAWPDGGLLSLNPIGRVTSGIHGRHPSWPVVPLIGGVVCFV